MNADESSEMLIPSDTYGSAILMRHAGIESSRVKLKYAAG